MNNSSGISASNGKEDHISTEEEKLGELVHIIFGGVLLIVGTIGNCCSLIILRTGDLKKLSTCFYMSMLAIADLGVLWSGTFPTLVKYATDWEMDPRNWIDCRLQRFIMHISIHLSAYFLVIMSAEKCFALHFPLQAKNLCSVNNAMKISVVNATIFSVYNTQWFFTLEKIYVKKINWFRCQIVNGPQFLKLHWRDVDAIIASYVPMVLMLSFNSAIIILLCINRGKDLGVGSTSKDMSKITKQVTAMLLSVTFVFIMLKCPVAIYMHTVGIHIRDDPITMSILTNFIYTNSSINTFLYMFCGSKYRERAFAIFKCLCVKNVEPSKQSSTTGPETEMQTISSALE